LEEDWIVDSRHMSGQVVVATEELRGAVDAERVLQPYAIEHVDKDRAHRPRERADRVRAAKRLFIRQTFTKTTLGLPRRFNGLVQACSDAHEHDPGIHIDPIPGGVVGTERSFVPQQQLRDPYVAVRESHQSLPSMRKTPGKLDR